MDDLAARSELNFGDGERNEKLGMVLVIFLQFSIELIVFRVIEERDPLLVLVILYDLLVEEVLLERHRDGAEELLVVQVLHNDANNFFWLGVAKRDHHSVRVFKVGAVYEFHVPVDIEADLFLVLVVVHARLKVNIVHFDIELVTELELGTPYSLMRE